MKYKSFKSSIADVNEKGIVTIAISSFDTVDAVGDIVRKGAFTKTFKEGSGRIKHVIDHTLRQVAVVGLPVKMYETKSHAVVESALNLEKQIARDLFADYKFFREHGKSLEHSFAYQTIKGESRTKGEEIHELKMFEYSTVAMAANGNTPLLDLKSFKPELLEEYLRKYDVSDAKGRKVERQINIMKCLDAYTLKQ